MGRRPPSDPVPVETVFARVLVDVTMPPVQVDWLAQPIVDVPIRNLAATRSAPFEEAHLDRYRPRSRDPEVAYPHVALVADPDVEGQRLLAVLDGHHRIAVAARRGRRGVRVLMLTTWQTPESSPPVPR